MGCHSLSFLTQQQVYIRGYLTIPVAQALPHPLSKALFSSNMVSKIVMSRKKARTADYIGRHTNRGYKGRVVRDGTRSSRTNVDPHPALQPPPRLTTTSKRPRTDNYSPQRPVTPKPLSPSLSSDHELDDNGHLDPSRLPPSDDNDPVPIFRPQLLKPAKEMPKGQGAVSKPARFTDMAGILPLDSDKRRVYGEVGKDKSFHLSG